MKRPYLLVNLVTMCLLLATMGCNKENDSPIIEINLQNLEIALDENPTEGQILGTVLTDGNEPSGFSITSQTPIGALSIDASTGELTVADASIFDFEVNPIISAIVTAENATNSSVITIDLNDLFEPSVPGSTNTEFVIGADAYITPKAYLLVDDAAGDYDRAFTFVFTDGEIIEDATNEIAFETATTVFTKISCNLIATKPTLAETSFFIWDPQTNPNGFLSIIMDGHNFSQFGISGFSDTNSIGGQTFGQPNGGTTHNHTALPNGDSSNGNLFTINARTFDLNTMTGTIDCSYSYVDDSGTTVTGVFVGNYEILTAY